MATTISELTYDLSVRSLSQQESALNELRSRTGVLLAATAIAIALLGGRALDDGGRTVIDLAGAGLAIVSFTLSVFVLAPKRDFAFVIDAAEAHETLRRTTLVWTTPMRRSSIGTERRGRRIRL